MNTESVVQLVFDLTPNGVKKNIRVFSDSAEGREEGLQRLQKCLPQIELLEAALQSRD